MRLIEKDILTLERINDAYCYENDIHSDTSSDDISILDRRNDGASVYYYIKKKSRNDDIYIWELENKLGCSKAKIEKFNSLFKQKQKLKRNKIQVEERSKRKKIKERLLPCACITESPIDLNRSFRGSICDF